MILQYWLIINIDKQSTGERKKQCKILRFPNRNIQNKKSDSEVDAKAIWILPGREDW